MAVSDYLQKTSGTCRYSYSKLKDVLYLVSSEHVKNVHIDNGEAYIDDLTELPLKINGFNIQFNEETSLDERYKFQKTLTLSMTGYVNYKIFGGRYYAIVEDYEGTFYMVNVDFPSRITHTFNLSQNTNQTDFTFSSLSNFPTLKLNAEFEAVEPVCLGLNVYGIDKLQLIEKEKARLDTVNKTVIATEDFKTIEFLGNSCSYQEVYDGFKATDTITFNIAFDNYKPSWQWNLLEFLDNKYASIITPRGNDNLYFVGFNFGLQPSYTIQTASQQGETDIITVTLTESSSMGSIAAVDWREEQSGETRWRYVKNVADTICYECIGFGEARYLVRQEVDLFGNPTGNYKVMEGYESQYPNFHIVGTFTTEEIFPSTDCTSGRTCDIQTNIPTTISFNAITCNTYSLQTSCDWRFADIPSNITVSPTSGVANSSYTVSICNTVQPSATPIENYMTLNCCTTSRAINMRVQTDTGCIRPTTQNINCLSQDVVFTFGGSCSIQITSIDSRLTYTIATNTLTIRVPRNNSTSSTAWTIVATNCNCSSTPITVYINQDKTYEMWAEDDGYICESGNSYHIERRYTGTTSSNYVRTDETRKGSLIQSGDTRCGSVQTKWEWDNESYTCEEGNKLKLIFEYISYDDGSTWTKTGNVTLGEVVESASTWCEGDVTYSWVLTNNWVCDFTPPFEGKFKAIYADSSTYSAECDSNTDLTRTTTRPSGYEYSAMTSAIIGDCITNIGYNSFYYCTSLTSVTIPNSVTSIGYGAFGGCSSLTSIDIPDSVTSIGDSAFGWCGSLTSINIPSGVTSIGETAFYECSSLTSINIPSGVTTINNSTFGYCSSLTSVSIPSGVTSIGYDAFSHCTSLTSINIPSGVTSIGEEAFDYCGSLTSSIDIPSGVTSIEANTFRKCSGLTSVTIPDSVTSIGNSAFNGCSSLTAVTIPSDVTYLDDYAFQHCSGLTSVAIPDSVTSIGRQAFGWCGGLTSVTIGSGVTSIGKEAFVNCRSLASLTVEATTPPTLGEKALYNTSYGPIYVPAQSVEAYKQASGWSSYASRITAISS